MKGKERFRLLLAAALLLVLFALGGQLFLPVLQKNEGTILLVAAGDILLDRGVRRQMELYDYAYPYTMVKEFLRRGDVVFANLESPLLEGGTPALKNRGLIFRGAPDNARALQEAGFTILSLANNHTMDYGPAGLSSTLDLLELEGILPLGAGRTAEEARRPVYIAVEGTVLGFLGYSVFPPEGYISLPHRPEIARVDPSTLTEEVRAAKRGCDFLVVSFHWGREYDFYAGEQQKELARQAVDGGTNLVLGHHPHVMQGIELYEGSLIFYSLGNFVFDGQIQPGTGESYILELSLSGGEWQEAVMLPVKIENSQPQPASVEEGEEILLRLQKYSRDLPASLSIREGQGYISRDKN